MMTLPKRLLSWLLDKLMPSSLASMVTMAVAYEKRLEEMAQGAALGARQGPPARRCPYGNVASPAGRLASA